MPEEQPTAMICKCGHHSHVHQSDPSGMAGSPCWESLDGKTDQHGYPINRCPCDDYNPKVNISVRCYGAMRGNGNAYVELRNDHLSIVVGSGDLHLMLNVEDWRRISAAVNRLLDGPLTHRVALDDVVGIATTMSVTTPVSS